ncbi:MAG: hypothetical protein EOO28_23895 [Comamonadaceae bacterium]|nr:MAG: hypothetical protein EOO28_23895 [Comamonadaceae bacterium]
MKLTAEFFLSTIAPVAGGGSTRRSLRKSRQAGKNVAARQGACDIAPVCSPFGVLVAASVAVFLFLLVSWLLPTSLAGRVQAVLGWLLAASVAALALASVLGALEKMLDQP